MNVRKFIIGVILGVVSFVHQAHARDNTTANVSCPTQQQITWSVSCCSLWSAMLEFTIEKTGTHLSTCDINCEDMKLIHILRHQINVTLRGKANIDLENQHLKISFPSEINDEIIQMLAFSVIGRVISKDDQAPIQLVYDTQYDKLTIQRPTCEYSKSIYNSIVLASVVLLIFFIGMQVIEQNSQIQTQKVKEHTQTLKHNTSHHDSNSQNGSTQIQMRLPFKL